MASTTQLKGFVFDAEGDGKSGLTATLYDTTDTDTPLATDTTTANGKWEFDDKDNTKTYDVKITDGTKNIWIKGYTEAQLTTLSVTDYFQVGDSKFVIDSNGLITVAKMGGNLDVNGNDLTGVDKLTGEDTSNALTIQGEVTAANLGNSIIFNTNSDADSQTQRIAIQGGKTAATTSIFLKNAQLDVRPDGTNPRFTIADTVVTSLVSTVIGANSATQGKLTLWDGGGGNTPAYILLHSPNGTASYLFVEDDGTLKRHTSAPTQNSDGSAVGDQTD